MRVFVVCTTVKYMHTRHCNVAKYTMHYRIHGRERGELYSQRWRRQGSVERCTSDEVLKWTAYTANEQTLYTVEVYTARAEEEGRRWRGGQRGRLWSTSQWRGIRQSRRWRRRRVDPVVEEAGTAGSDGVGAEDAGVEDDDPNGG